MKLKNKNAVIYGAGGAIGSTVAKAFAREGAKVFLTGRNLASVATTAGEIIAAGGTAEAAQVDALDEGAVEGHIAAVVEKAGTVDISFNAITPIPQPGTQGIPIAQLPVESFHSPHHGVHAIVFFDRAGRRTAYGRDSVKVSSSYTLLVWAHRWSAAWARRGRQWKVLTATCQRNSDPMASAQCACARPGFQKPTPSKSSLAYTPKPWASRTSSF